MHLLWKGSRIPAQNPAATSEDVPLGAFESQEPRRQCPLNEGLQSSSIYPLANTGMRRITMAARKQQRCASQGAPFLRPSLLGSVLVVVTTIALLIRSISAIDNAYCDSFSWNTNQAISCPPCYSIFDKCSVSGPGSRGDMLMPRSGMTGLIHNLK